jgi:hypothetical protein
MEFEGLEIVRLELKSTPLETIRQVKLLEAKAQY